MTRDLLRVSTGGFSSDIRFFFQLQILPDGRSRNFNKRATPEQIVADDLTPQVRQRFHCRLCTASFTLPKLRRNLPEAQSHISSALFPDALRSPVQSTCRLARGREFRWLPIVSGTC